MQHIDRARRLNRRILNETSRCQQPAANRRTDTAADLDGEGVVQGIEMGAMSPSAMGFAVDLGAVYDMNHIVPGLTLSASFVDLGYINWKYMLQGQSADAKVEGEPTVPESGLEARFVPYTPP